MSNARWFVRPPGNSPRFGFSRQPRDLTKERSRLRSACLPPGSSPYRQDPGSKAPTSPAGPRARPSRGPGVLERRRAVVIALDGAPGVALGEIAAELARLLPGGASQLDVGSCRSTPASGDDGGKPALLLPSGIDAARLEGTLRSLRARGAASGPVSEPGSPRRVPSLEARPFVILYGAFALADPGVRRLVDLGVYVDLDRRESIRRLTREVSEGAGGLRARLDVSRVLLPRLLAEAEGGRRSAELQLSGGELAGDLARSVCRSMAALLAAW